jgi:hypothetical protein
MSKAWLLDIFVSIKPTESLIYMAAPSCIRSASRVSDLRLVHAISIRS